MRARIEIAVPLTLVLAFFLVAAIDVAAFPYHEWDALSYGEWSRLIGEHWRLHFAGISDQTYQRPLLYVLQGIVWGVFGFSERLGRSIDLCFGIALVITVFELTRRLSSRLGAAIAAALLLLVPQFQRGVASGLTDVPVAAMIALAGLAVFVESPILIALAACGATLTKTSALPALLGLGLMCAVGERDLLVARARRLIVPLLAGVAAGLVWDVVQARDLHEGLMPFLRAGSTGYYAMLAAYFRRQAFFGADWLGGTLRVLVLFALLYAVLRSIGLRHRAASIAALVGSAVCSYLGPLVATHFHSAAVGPFDTWPHELGFLALIATLTATVRAPADAIPSSTTLRRLLAWACPPFVVWAWAGAYDVRLLSPAWPPMIILCALALHTAIRGSRGRFSLLVAPAAAALVIAIVAGFENVDGIGRAHWNEIQTSSSGFFDLQANRSIALPEFSEALEVVRGLVGANGRVFSSDGKFHFFFPSRATQSYARSCADLRGYSAFVLLTDSASLDYMQANHFPSDVAFWSRCEHPKLTVLTQPSLETVFGVSNK